jgi:hypothetical protein
MSKYAIITPEQLKAAETKLGFKPGEMAKRLKTPRRTYQDWIAGKRPISGACDTAVELLLREDARFMANIGGKDTREAKGGPRISDLAMMIKLLCRALLKAAPNHLLPIKYMEYLKRHNLQGSPLREDHQTTSEGETA